MQENFWSVTVSAALDQIEENCGKKLLCMEMLCSFKSGWILVEYAVCEEDSERNEINLCLCVGSHFPDGRRRFCRRAGEGSGK